jgi:hypothetical protein
MRPDVAQEGAAGVNPAETGAGVGSMFGQLKNAASQQAAQKTRDEVSKKADTQVRHRLAALKTLAPLVLAVVKRPGFAAEDGELLAAAKQLQEETSRSSAELVMLMGAGGQPAWMAKAIASTVAESVAAEWISGVEVLDMSPYQPIWGYLADADFADFEADMPKEGNLDQDTMIRLSTIKAMSQVVSTTRRSYLMRHDPDKLYPMLAKVIVKTAGANVDKLVSPEATDAARLMALQSLIARAAELFCSNWDAVVKPTVSYLLRLDREQRLKLYSQHPDGLPLGKIVEGFAADMARLVGGISAFEFRPHAEPGHIKIGE